MSISLGEEKMKIVKERFPNTLRERSNLFFVFGSDDTNPHRHFEDIEQFVASTLGWKSIPGDDEQTHAVLLLYFPSHVEAQIAVRVQFKNSPKNFTRHVRSWITNDIILNYIFKTWENMVRLVEVKSAKSLFDNLRLNSKFSA